MKKWQDTATFALLAIGVLTATVAVLLSSLALPRLRALAAANTTTTNASVAAIKGARVGISAQLTGGALDPASCCRFAQDALPPLLGDLRAFMRKIDSNRRFVQTGHWSAFVSTVPDLETAPVNNSYLTTLKALRGRAALFVDASEGAPIQAFLRELDLVLNLTALDAYFMHADNPWITAAAVLDILPGFSSERDFSLRVLTWLSELDTKAARWLRMGARALAAGKVHSNVTLVAQYDLGTGAALGADYGRMCRTAFAGDKKSDERDACLVYAGSIELKLAAIRTWWLDTYMPAAAVLRPNEAPGLHHVPDGAAIYAALQRYHLHQAVDANELYTLGDSGLSAILGSEYARLAPLILGNSVATASDLVRALGNVSDTRLYWCTDDPAEVVADAYAEFGAVQALLAPMFGFLPGAPLRIVAGNQPRAVFEAGAYDPAARTWTSAGTLYLARYGPCNPGGPGENFFAYARAGLRSSVVREGLPGRALQVPLAARAECAGDDDPADSAADSDGWTFFAERVMRERGAYNFPLDALGSAQMQALQDAALRVDACLHGNDTSAMMPACDLVSAGAMLAVVGLPPAVIEAELQRYLAAPGRALGARVGDLGFAAARAAVLSVESTDERFFRQVLRHVSPGGAVRDPACERV